MSEPNGRFTYAARAVAAAAVVLMVAFAAVFAALYASMPDAGTGR